MLKVKVEVIFSRGKLSVLCLPAVILKVIFLLVGCGWVFQLSLSLSVVMLKFKVKVQVALLLQPHSGNELQGQGRNSFLLQLGLKLHVPTFAK